MNKWGERSLKNRKTLHPDLNILADTVLKFVDCSIVDGHRDKETQDDYFYSKPRRSKVQWPNSKHNKMPSQAMDLYMYPIEINNTNRNYWFAGVVFGIAKMLYEQGIMKHKVRGGWDWDGDNDFKDQDFNDLVHVELVGV